MTTFTYDISALLTKIQTSALFVARNIKQDRSADFSKLSIVDAETFLLDKIRTISSKIFADIFSQYARDLTDPYLFDADNEGVSGDIVYSTEFPTTNFDANLLPSILQAGEDLIINYVVAEWLRISNYDYRNAEDIYKEDKKEMLGLVSRRYSYARKYKLF